MPGPLAAVPAQESQLSGGLNIGEFSVFPQQFPAGQGKRRWPLNLTSLSVNA